MRCLLMDGPNKHMIVECPEAFLEIVTIDPQEYMNIGALGSFNPPISEDSVKTVKYYRIKADENDAFYSITPPKP